MGGMGVVHTSKLFLWAFDNITSDIQYMYVVMYILLTLCQLCQNW